MARARDGDEAAFALAYRLLQPCLLGYARGLVGHEGGAARDVTAEAWRELAREVVRFRGCGADFRTLAAAATRRRALTRVRPERPPAPLADLPWDQADAVLLRVVVGLDSRAAAKVLGRRRGAVRAAAHRGVRGLARRVADAPSPAGGFR